MFLSLLEASSSHQGLARASISLLALVVEYCKWSNNSCLLKVRFFVLLQTIGPVTLGVQSPGLKTESDVKVCIKISTKKRNNKN